MAISPKQTTAVEEDAAVNPSEPSAGPQPGGGFEYTVVAVLTDAIEAHKAGNLADAETGYRRVLEISADHPHAIHFLGVLAHQKGDNENAVGLIRQAIDILPDFADAYSNLGAAFHAMRGLQDAEDSFRKAAQLKPNLAEAHSNLAAVLMERGNKAEAIESYETAHRLAPLNAKFVKRLGDLYLEAEDFDKAIEWFEKFFGVARDDGEVSNNIGYACERSNRLDRAEEWYRKAVQLCPDSPEMNNNLGSILSRTGKLAEADEYFAKALDVDPSKWANMSHMAGTYINRGEPHRAIPIYEMLVGQDPDNAKMVNDYGAALAGAGRIFDAEPQFRRALELNPEFAEGYNSLGSALLLQGNRPEAIECFKKAIELKPDYLSAYINICHVLAHSERLDEAYLYAQSAILLPDYTRQKFSNPNKVFRAVCDFDAIATLGDPWENIEMSQAADFAINFLEMLVVAETEEEVTRLAELHKRWGRNVLPRMTMEPLAPLDLSSRSGKIRIAFVSSDLRNHSVAKFVLPVLENYDRDRYEIYCYSPFDSPNDTAQTKIKGLVKEFRVIENVGDRDFAEVIRADEIDIAFELNGFTRDNRLKVFAYRPAPVQVYWLGYPFTTGVQEIDYVLLDPYVKPSKEDLMVEKPILMPDCWVCFGNSFNPEPISEDPPLDRNGFVTFGSMNNPYKITREALTVWCDIMNQVPDSRFLYVRPELKSMVLCNNLINEFGRHGIGPERLFMVNNRKLGLSHFSYYEEIDITLDTFPLVGGTTTCDTLWMGAPVITKVGPGMHQRLGYSILKNVGLDDLCVETNEEYVEKAVALARDPESLRLLRRELRPALQESILCRAEDYSRAFFLQIDEMVARHGLR